MRSPRLQMSFDHQQFLTALSRLSRDQIEQAGQRYTPGIDPKAPNLRIESVLDAINSVVCGDAALARFQSVLSNFFEAWGGAKYSSQRREAIQALVEDAETSLSSMICQMRRREIKAGTEWQDRLTSIESCLVEDIEHWRAEESQDQSKARGNIRALGRCLAIVREELEYARGDAFKVLSDPKLLVSGEWGTGKTHLLCDVTNERIALSLPTVFVLAKNFEGNIVSEVCSRIEADQTIAQVFDRLEVLARSTSERALVVLEGVNEGRRLDWRKAVKSVLELVADRPNLGLIVTCRTPFEHIAIDKSDLEKFNNVRHFGFDDQEFEAQSAFFEFYNLPLPEVPLLDKEFSRPLTLKLICESLQNLKGKKLAKGFSGIASGQRGMTYVLESFANRVGEPIERDLNLRRKGVWELLKGSDSIADKRLAGFAPCMAAKMRGHVLQSEADRIVRANYPDLKPAMRRTVIESLRTNGLIEEDAVWYSSKSGIKSRIVYRLPYQRFSDHLIARHLLKAYLDVSSTEAIKQSFSGKSPLARVFAISRGYQREFAEPGWAQALITEFAERTAKRLPNDQCELFFALPTRSKNLDAYFTPFIEGVFWRNPSTFTEGTRAVINRYLNGGARAWEQTIDALAAVSTKPKHPYNASRLYTYLANLPMADRDIRWSEYLRRRYASPTIHRLLEWAEKLSSAKMTENSASELIILFSLVLTTVVRRDRDVATKALVLIGERFPRALFEHATRSLEFNDPYVSERMLAAAYGATLSLVDSEVAQTFRFQLGCFAAKLYKEMFELHALNGTHHALTKDYALGIIEIASRENIFNLPKGGERNLSEPFIGTSSKFASDGNPDSVVNEAIGHAIQMDFGNYTIGRLIPDRANYDHGQPDYVQVRAKIEKRMFDLGYRVERFGEIDKEIGRDSWNARDEVKVDRYGKKYSWIAFFEMWGERDASGRLPDWRSAERPPDCGIDPSFPKRPPKWEPPSTEFFPRQELETAAWVEGGDIPDLKPMLVVPEINGQRGDWVLLQGFLRATSDSLDRELFAFMRGVFIDQKDLSRLKKKFLEVEYPGNDAIPEGATEHYLYAGEAGRRKNFARHLYAPNGRYRRQVEEAFDTYERAEKIEESRYPSIQTKVLSEGGKEDRISSIQLRFGEAPKMRHIPGISVEIPYINFGWESHHSSQNDFSGFYLPEPSLIQRLGLKSKNREIDFYDLEGVPGTLYREGGDGWNGDHHRLLYIRSDLLQSYLKETGQVLVWCNWGERDWLKKMDGHNVIRDSVRQRIYQSYSHIHRSFSQWPSKDGNVV